MDQLYSFLIASILLTLSPGPDIIYVLVQSLVKGRKAGIQTAAGLVSGVLIHTALLAFGVSMLIKQSEMAFGVLKIAGACYLFYLAYQTYIADSSIKLKAEVDRHQNGRQRFVRGLVMNVINPKVILFFLAFMPGFLWDSEEAVKTQFFMLGALFMLQAFLIFSTVSFLADRIAQKLRDHSQVGNILKWLQIIVYIGIGVFILI